MGCGVDCRRCLARAECDEMKIPHFLFRIINVVVVTTLRSPLHTIFSGSILAICYVGIKSGRRRSVPMRYLSEAADVLAVTSKDTAWWPNFLSAAPVEVLLRGQCVEARVQAIADRPDLVAPVMREMWARHPADASYMHVKIQGGEPDPEDFARALATAVLIRIVPGG